MTKAPQPQIEPRARSGRCSNILPRGRSNRRAQALVGDPHRFALNGILWYQQGRISQGKAAEIAGMNRVVFLNALDEAGVEAIQVTEDELRQELELPTRADSCDR